MIKISLLLILISGIFLSSGVEPAADAAWPTIDTVLVAGGFDEPVHIIHAGDGSGRLFIVEQPGRIKILHNDSSQSIFLDITDRVRSVGNEEGLLSLAFSPGYSTSLPHFYVYYTQADGNNVVSRFSTTGDPNEADASSEEKILVLEHPNFSNHNGGQLAFGPDGYLYIATGDGGGGGDPQGNAQNPASLLGKILRIETIETQVSNIEGNSILYLPLLSNSGSTEQSNYKIPPDNPYVGVPGFRAEIWALGLRNPWRFSFDRQTGDLFIADVGQNRSEEVDFQPAASTGGENYGWNIMEGFDCYPNDPCDKSNLVLPVFTYPTDTGCSITGGFVYRGSVYPGMQGIYFVGDFCTGAIWGLQQSGNNWENSLLLASGSWISTFGEAESGELFFADRQNGNIYRVIEAP
jgi:glucose/arabinose dehydrogenase